MNGCCHDKKFGHPGACTEATCMRIPNGKQCHDCLHMQSCVRIFGVKPTDRNCDFFPRRFLDVLQAKVVIV